MDEDALPAALRYAEIAVFIACGEPLAYAHGSVTHSRVSSVLPSRDR
jgi:hypothetical protein